MVTRRLREKSAISGSPSSEKRRAIAAWVADHVMPHEGNVRAWLIRRRIPPEDIDDLIQEAYSNLASLKSIDGVERPGAYFFSIVRNLLFKEARQAKVVDLVPASELDFLRDERPLPERQVGSQLELERVERLIADLGDPCATVVHLRKIEGRSQREIAQLLGISEGMVEWHVHNGIKSILKRMRRDEADREAASARRQA